MPASAVIQNSESDPPGIKAVIVVLPADLPIPELEPDRKVGPHLGVGGQSVYRCREIAAPEYLERDRISVHYRMLDVELLRPECPLALLGGVEKRLQIAMRTDWGQAVRKFLLLDVLGEELSQRATLGAVFQGLQVAARDREIVGRRHRHDIISGFGCVVQHAG